MNLICYGYFPLFFLPNFVNKLKQLLKKSL